LHTPFEFYWFFEEFVLRSEARLGIINFQQDGFKYLKRKHSFGLKNPDFSPLLHNKTIRPRKEKGV